MGLRFLQACRPYTGGVVARMSGRWEDDDIEELPQEVTSDDTDLLSRMRVRMGERPQVVNFTRARIGRDVLQAMNGDISKLRLNTSGGLLTGTSLEQGPLLHGNYDEENLWQKAFNGTLHRRRGKPLVGVWFLEVDPDGYVWLQRIWDSRRNAVDDVYEVLAVEPPRGRTIRKAISSRSKRR